MITQKLHSNSCYVIMTICCFLLLFTTGCVTTPQDEQLETNGVPELWPYMDWRTNGGEEIRYREHRMTTARPSGSIDKAGTSIDCGWFLEDIQIKLQDIK